MVTSTYFSIRYKEHKQNKLYNASDRCCRCGGCVPSRRRCYKRLSASSVLPFSELLLLSVVAKDAIHILRVL
jgi:hypothetical protein